MEPFELYCDPFKFVSCSLSEFLKTSTSHCRISDPKVMDLEVQSMFDVST